MPVSKPPRKKRRPPPSGAGASRARRHSPLMRAVVLLGTGVLVASLALLTVFSTERRQEAQRRDTPEPAAAETTTSTIPTDPSGCPNRDGTSPRRTDFPASGPPECLFVGYKYSARITTDMGTFMIELHPEQAPRSVNTFVVLARYHFYDDLLFHRAVPDLFAQSGNPREPGVTGPGYVYDDAVPEPGSYTEGSVVMANEGAGTNGSQFLIFVGPNAANLPNQYPLFGTVTQGLEVVKRIARNGTETGDPNVVHRLLKVTIIEEPIDPQ